MQLSLDDIRRQCIGDPSAGVVVTLVVNAISGVVVVVVVRVRSNSGCGGESKSSNSGGSS